MTQHTITYDDATHLLVSKQLLQAVADGTGMFDSNMVQMNRFLKATGKIRDLLAAAPQPEAVSRTAPSDIDIQEVREYLDQWGCLAHPGVRALLSRCGQRDLCRPRTVEVNMKFVKKPIPVEATQWFKNGDHPKDNVQSSTPGTIGSEGHVVRYFNRPGVSGSDVCRHCHTMFRLHGWIDTLEGGHIVCPGDWIITGVSGENYPCKPDVFAATYEPVEEP